MQIVFRKYKGFWIMLVRFNLTLVNLTLNSPPETHVEVQAAPRKEKGIFFVYGAPVTQHFFGIKCTKFFTM